MCKPKFASNGAVIIGSNMSEITLFDGTKILYSYSTPVAAEVAGVKFRTEKQWSNTTSKHISKWGAKDAERLPQDYFDKLDRSR